MRVKVNFKDNKRNPDLYPRRSVEVYNPAQFLRGMTPPTVMVANEAGEQAEDLNAAPAAESPIPVRTGPTAVPAADMEGLEPPTKCHQVAECSASFLEKKQLKLSLKRGTKK